MRIVQLVAQVQIQFEDGSTLAFGTPQLVPEDSMTEETVRQTLMSLGMTPEQYQRQARSGAITPANQAMVEAATRGRGPRIFNG